MDNSANWSLGTPTASQNVAINTSATITLGSSDVSNNLSISGTAVQFTGVGTLTTKTLSVNSGATLTIAGNSSVIVAASTGPQVTDNGTINLGDATTVGKLFINAASGEVATGLAGSIVLGAKNFNNILAQSSGGTEPENRRGRHRQRQQRNRRPFIRYSGQSRQHRG